MYMTCKLCNIKVQSIKNMSCNFREKIKKTFQKISIPQPDSLVVAPQYLKLFYAYLCTDHCVNDCPCWLQCAALVGLIMRVFFLHKYFDNP